MKIAIIGASGHCGRQVAIQLLDRRIVPENGLIQLVGHRGGTSESCLWSLLADLEGAFSEHAPTLQIVLDASHINADVVVMLAGRTLGTDIVSSADRSILGRENASLFSHYAKYLSLDRNQTPLVIVQSNPVELGVKIFAEALGRKKVLGAGAWSDTLRLRSEIAKDLGVRRTDVQAWMLGQHGVNIVPCLSQISAWGVDEEAVKNMFTGIADSKNKSRYRSNLLARTKEIMLLVKDRQVLKAYESISKDPPEIRACLKPLFTHFTGEGHSTEVMTAHAVVDILSAIAEGRRQVFAAQVLLEGEWLGIHGVLGVPIVLGPEGWDKIIELNLNEAEKIEMKNAAYEINQSNLIA